MSSVGLQGLYKAGLTPTSREREEDGGRKGAGIDMRPPQRPSAAAEVTAIKCSPQPDPTARSHRHRCLEIGSKTRSVRHRATLVVY